MPWLQIKIDVTPEQSDAYEDILLAAGCAAVTFEDAKDQPIFEPDLGTTPLWSSTTLTGLFDATYDLNKTLEFVRASHQEQFADQPLPPTKAEILEDKDWERAWMDNYHPMQFGEKLWICPSWREVPDPDAVNLMLDPGLAFGTGTHPTTALCLQWLDSEPLQDKTVVDFGCGSGILGIAALLLGAQHVNAIDIDPQALQATADNMERNNISDDQLQAYLPEKAPEVEADYVVANILAGPLEELAPTIASHVKSGGRLALSGLLSNQAEQIQKTYSQWFDLEPIAQQEDWIRVTGTKR